MRKTIVALGLACALALGALAGCTAGEGKQESSDSNRGLDPSNPVSITVWHYYNGAQQVAFDELVSDFNATVGKERGIYVEGYSQGSVADLEKAVSSAAAGEVGAADLPDIFSTYADSAYSIEQQGKLADISRYVSEQELSEYVDSYIDEGYFGDDGALYLFPVAKSTEIMMVDQTDWDLFAGETGTSIDELSTTEGIARVAQRYYEWTDAQTPDVLDDGKAFYGRDSMSNYFVIGMKQMGVDIFDVNDGQVVLNLDEGKIRRLWDAYYVPYVNGYFTSLGRFRSDDMKTGDLIAYTGSCSSATYFPDQVVTDDGPKAIECLVLDAPVMEGGSKINVQQGASMAVAKSDERHEYAACEFLKWFTEKENNLRFVCDSSYLPVSKQANSTAALDEVIEAYGLSVAPKAYDCLKSVFASFDGMDFYTTKCFENGYETRKVLDYDLSDKAKADRAAIEADIARGASRAEAVAPYVTDEAFEVWYTQFSSALADAAKG